MNMCTHNNCHIIVDGEYIFLVLIITIITLNMMPEVASLSIFFKNEAWPSVH